MASTVRNNTRQLLILTLNSGQTLHLSPGASSGLLEDLELNDNAKITKLRDSGVLSVAQPEAASRASQPAEAQRKTQEGERSLTAAKQS